MLYGDISARPFQSVNVIVEEEAPFLKAQTHLILRFNSFIDPECP